MIYTRIPGRGELKVRSGSGDIEIYFPEKASIQTNLRSGSGETLNEIGHLPEGIFKVAAKSGSGDVKVKKLK